MNIFTIHEPKFARLFINIIIDNYVHLHHLSFVLSALPFLVETTVSYNETEATGNITEVEEIINKTTITTHQVAPAGKNV